MKVVLSLAVIAASVLGALAASSTSTAPTTTTLPECSAVCCPNTTPAPPTGSSTSTKPNPSPSTPTNKIYHEDGPSAAEATTTLPDCNKYIDGTNCVCPENSSSVVSFSMAALLLSSLVAMLL